MAEIVFINVGWMLRYRGDDPNDPIRGGHLYLRNNGEGDKAFNFKAWRGRYYGYIPGRNDLRISNFPTATRESVSGVTVVWVARHPQTGRYVIVGWYRDATITVRTVPGPWTLHREVIDCQISAPVAGSTLLDRELRTFPAPPLPQVAFGRSVIYYGNPKLNPGVQRFIESGGTWQGTAQRRVNTSPTRGGGRQNDPEERLRIEKAAVAHVTRYYQRAFNEPDCVKSVERERCGWDLEVRQRSGETLLVEVKGTSQAVVAAELTPNEYAQLLSPERRTQYVVFVVTQAGTRRERGHIFRHRQGVPHDVAWATDDGYVLPIEPLIAARLTEPK